MRRLGVLLPLSLWLSLTTGADAQPDAQAQPPAAPAEPPAAEAPADPPAAEAPPEPPAADASADPQTAACLQAFQDAQRLRRQGALLAARQQASQCGLDHCPEVVAEVCREWQVAIGGEIPTIIITANAPGGAPTTAVRVRIDGQLAAESLDGQAIELDPGAHVVQLEHVGALPIERQLKLELGDRDQRIAVTFEAPPPPPPPAPPPFTPAVAPHDAPRQAEALHPLVWVGLAVGGAGAVVGAITGGVSLSASSDVHDACPDKRCNEEQRDDYDRALALSHTATVSLAIGGAGFATALIAWLALSPDTSEEARAVEPLLGPGYLGARGSF